MTNANGVNMMCFLSFSVAENKSVIKRAKQAKGMAFFSDRVLENCCSSSLYNYRVSNVERSGETYLYCDICGGMSHIVEVRAQDIKSRS